MNLFGNSARLRMLGPTGKLVSNIEKNFLIGIEDSNPAILTVFRDRDTLPYRSLLPWSGEFAGKYLTSCAYAYRVTGNGELYDRVLGFIGKLLGYQAEDGYLGCFTEECRLSGKFQTLAEEACGTWDSWNHYHIMYGLLLWHGITGDPRYLSAVEKIAGLFISRFYGDNPPLISIGWNEMNLSVFHVFALLHRMTGKAEYLEFAKNVERDLDSESAGEYMRYATEGREYYQCPKPRWESLHAIMGFAEMFRITGEERYLRATENIFYSILKTDVHNTGAFSTDEQAVGTPFRTGSIETCCVVAFNALAIELYSLTHDPRIPDFLERSHYNAVLGYNSPSGRWSTYHTPMDGEKRANYDSIVFQSRPGSPDLNCCSVNAPRGVASLGEWIVSEKEDGEILINTYEAMDATLSDGTEISVSGCFPAPGKVDITVTGGKPGKLSLRIPFWSANTRLTVNGAEFSPESNSLFTVEKTGPLRICLIPDMTPFTEPGGGELEGKRSIFAGPLLFGLENAENPGLPFNEAKVSEDDLLRARHFKRDDGSTVLVLENGTVLKDFYHLGSEGAFYRTWL